MTHKKKIRNILLIAFFFAIIGLILALPEKVRLCNDGDLDCVRYYVYKFDSLASAFVVFSAPVILISFILFFLSELVFSVWLRFAKYYLPIAAILIILSPTVDSSILGFDKEFMTWLFSGIFFLTSLGIIIFKRRVKVV